MLQHEHTLLTLSDHAVIAPVNVHPQAAESERQTKALCERFGIQLPNIDEYNTMTAFMYPRTSVERLVTISLWMNFLWYIDDSYDRNKETAFTGNALALRRLLENCVLIQTRNYEVDDSQHHLYRVSRDLHRRFAALMPDAWLRRFEVSLMQHLKAATYNVEDVMSTGKPDVAQYIRLRELDGGMFPTIDLIELAGGFTLPDAVLEHPQLRHLIRLNARICTFSNDIFSYEKEVLRLGSRFNLIQMYIEGEEMSFPEALDASIRLVNADSSAFLDALNNVPRFGDAALDANVSLFVDCLKDQATAAYHWQLTTPRYRSPQSPHPELRQPLP